MSPASPLPLGVTLRDGSMAAGLGLLGAAAFPPLGLWPLALIGPALLLWLLRDCESLNARNLGLLYGLFLGLGTMYWLFGIFGPGGLVLVAIFAAYFGLLATLIALTRGWPVLARAAAVALFAVAVEWLRGDAWYLRFPWYTVPHALAAEPALIAPARWIGVYGLSFVVWLIAAWGAFGRPWAWAAFLLLPACALLLPPIEPPDQRALLLQAEEQYGVEKLIPRVPKESVDLAVLPEYAYHASPRLALASRQGPAELARRTGSPVVFGAMEDTADGYENVAVVIAPDGRILGSFPKQHPVPLLQDGQPGTRRPVFPVDRGTLGVAVCYDFDAPEVVASLTAQGATVLVAPTFDALHWGRPQHLNHALLFRLRAVENDRWIVRASSSGRSEAIDPHGHPSVEGVEIAEVGSAVVRYGHRDGLALGGQAHVLGPAAAIVTLLVVGGLAIRHWRRRRAADA